MEPLITIVTVCLNSEKTIEKTIKSVMEQKFENYEYIIIDGKSTDSTLDIIKNYQNMFEEKMVYVSEKDSGWYDAMNKGIMKARGRFVNFLNSDDYLAPDALTFVAKAVIENSVSDNMVVYGDSTNIYRNEDGRLLYRRIVAPKDVYKTKLRLVDGMCGIRHQSMFIGKKVFSDIGFFDLNYRLYADWDFFIKTIRARIPYFYVGKNLTFYSMYGISTRIDYLERHRVRKENHLYKGFDICLLRDRMGIKAILKKLLGYKRWNKLLFYYHMYVNSI